MARTSPAPDIYEPGSQEIGRKTQVRADLPRQPPRCPGCELGMAVDGVVHIDSAGKSWGTCKKVQA